MRVRDWLKLEKLRATSGGNPLSINVFLIETFNCVYSNILPRKTAQRVFVCLNLGTEIVLM